MTFVIHCVNSWPLLLCHIPTYSVYIYIPSIYSPQRTECDDMLASICTDVCWEKSRWVWQVCQVRSECMCWWLFPSPLAWTGHEVATGYVLCLVEYYRSGWPPTWIVCMYVGRTTISHACLTSARARTLIKATAPPKLILHHLSLFINIIIDSLCMDSHTTNTV